MRRHHGFTLLELLMVVIIIGILASIALPQYLRVTERARGSEALQNLAAMRGSEMRFKADAGGGVNYTNNLAALDIDVPTQAACAPAFGSTNWCFSEPGTGVALDNVRATRRNAGAATIDIDLDTGTTCSSAGATYGLTNGTC